MPPMKTSDFFKRKVYTATIQRHNGNQSDLGAPTYDVEADWKTIAAGWPCELLTATGGERLRGRQVSASTSHVLVGDPAAIHETIGPDCRVIVAGKRYNVTAVYDPDGLNRELRIECRQSW